ncbi:hypothetical protein P691DRAFT_805487 [Macrolepiota fuliginosa MF-IS2]|uniref:Mitochondrial distribution and morphology protein 12 n=1 Tax=Macrolepiota fuliginosa MF-IS2 TaxID=1400762 RepID=A0A9P5X8F0_9AGAR|nr:hypothetical protein P691DRAFT_805487 [Macrolepiota fuliginosa MF-IS2]
MSIDLDWLKLDSTLANNLIDLLNRQLDNAERPSFIGPVQVTSLDFGSDPPEVELVDMRDIYRDFLEDDEEEDHGSVKVTEGGAVEAGTEDEEGFEWVSRRAGVRGDSSGSEFLPPHIRHGYGMSRDYFSAAAVPAIDPWTSGLSRPLSFGYEFHSPLGAEVDGTTFRSPSPATPFVTSPARGRRPPQTLNEDASGSINIPLSSAGAGTDGQLPQEPLPSPHPNLQLHFNVRWPSNLRISLQTSLLINYPSSMFMSLPIRLSITGLVFDGELVVAYEGEKRRVHICVLDDLDPYGPTGGRKITSLGTGSNSSLNSNSPFGAGAGAGGSTNYEGSSSTPPELEDSIIMGAAGPGLGGPSSLGVGNATLSSPHLFGGSGTLLPAHTAIMSPLGPNRIAHPRPSKPNLPTGQRLLPSIFIESEIGQADKHVLKNVTRVERFIQDVVRKTLEEELVFPNFHTLLMNEG